MSIADSEKPLDLGWVENNSQTTPSTLKLDRHGLPLAPQPSDHPDDPLNWSIFYKIYIALLISLLGFVVQMGAALINPAFEEMSEDLSITVEQASYCTTVFILFGGVVALLVVPFANIYGRRPAFVISGMFAFAGQFVSGGVSSYGGVIAGRVLNGTGASVPLGIGAALICDLFYQGERGLYMGIYILSVTNGPHVAPIAGGYVAERLGWRWCFWIPGIIQAGLWVVTTLTLPETLFSRREAAAGLKKRSFMQKLLFHGKVVNRSVKPRDFFGSLRMAQYLAVLLPTIWYAAANAWGSTIFAVTGAHICVEVFDFDLDQIGLFLGVPLTVGCMIGEATAGWVSDVIINAYARRHNGHHKPEARLYLLPLATLLGIGTATYGYCVQASKLWIIAAICMAISGLGTQVGNTIVYTYTTDSYKPQSGEIGAVINLLKSSKPEPRFNHA
ncbi:uncharacterized protein LTR77_007286 [Saxophila tyrrhenica]|uniref:Major facilitator superfamily (MFS) profile domain-containing protein n=1 Tax=Saxophila tyrrhenica TaxID=1690608 RepID=A0AAV9P785_9PEZI|nr:hypothetical protein LTR77_007286 [Saxophila tyrrhenica]